jgi:hypothetical protein
LHKKIRRASTACRIVFMRSVLPQDSGPRRIDIGFLAFLDKKQGAAGITTAAVQFRRSSLCSADGF